MIILDEQLLGRGIEDGISQWYPGAVRFITDLRPGTVIKDDAIPQLLSREAEPTFVTINVTDFWLRVPISGRYCVVCVSLPDSRAGEIPALLRQLFRHVSFRTKALRAGHVVRIAPTGTSFYSEEDRTVRTI